MALSAILKGIRKAPSKTAAKSAASAGRNEIRSNKRMTGDKEEAAINKINKAFDDQVKKIDARKEAAKPKKKRPPADKDKRKQSPKEREGSAIGRVSAKTTTQQNKKEGVGSMVAYTSAERGKIVADAGKDLRAGKITQAEHDRIVARVDAKNEGEVVRASKKASEAARSRKMQGKVSLADELPALKSIEKTSRTTRKKKPSEMTRAELREALAKEDKAGVSARQKAKAKRGFAKGGTPKPNSRFGSIDMRKGGMFR